MDTNFNNQSACYVGENLTDLRKKTVLALAFVFVHSCNMASKYRAGKISIWVKLHK